MLLSQNTQVEKLLKKLIDILSIWNFVIKIHINVNINIPENKIYHFSYKDEPNKI